MDTSIALETLSALAQETRLKVVVLLAGAGRSGMASGDIANALGIPRHLMSTHLKVLTSAGAIFPVKEGRSVVYSIRDDTLLRLSQYIRALASPGEEAPSSN